MADKFSYFYTMKKISPALENEYAVYYHTYIKQLDPSAHVLKSLKEKVKEIESTLLSLSEAQLCHTYAPGKWTIKDIMMHLVDSERVFLYRAMRFARNDKTPLPFFDENEFAKQAQAGSMSIKKILKEYKSLRMSTLAFFDNQTIATLKRKGIAGSTPTSVRACAWIICGHELHHWEVIKKKYLQA